MIIDLFIKLEVGVSMLNKKGMTLIESLLAFDIFISVLVVFLSLFTTLYQQESRIQKQYESLMAKEGELSFCNEFIETITMALH